MNFQEAQGLCKSKGMKLPSSDAKSDKFISILDQLRKCLYIPETYFDTMFWLDAMIFRNGSYFGDETLKNQTKADFKKKKIKVAFHIFLDESKSKINLAFMNKKKSDNNLCLSSDEKWALQYCGFGTISDRHHLQENVTTLFVCIKVNQFFKFINSLFF